MPKYAQIGGDYVDAIFRISGSFANGLEWHKDDPCYEGSIVITPKDEVFGVADMYHSGHEQTRILYGKIIPIEKQIDCLMLLMLSPKEPEKALFVTVPDVNYSDEGEWAPVTYDIEKDFFDINCHSLVSFDAKFVDYSSMERRRIRYTYNFHLLKSDEYNRQLIKALNTLGGTTIGSK